MIPDGWKIERYLAGGILLAGPGSHYRRVLYLHTDGPFYALCDALLRSEQERSEEAGDAAKCDAAFDRWYAAQRHQLTNEQVCRLIWTRGWNAAIDTAMAKGDSK